MENGYLDEIITTWDGRMIKRINPDSKFWEQQAYTLARTWVGIKPCVDCGGPVIQGYCCTRCGSDEP